MMYHLKNLQKKGLIHREANMSRAIQLLQEDTGTKTIECPHCKKMIELPLRSIN
jgi:SOS-response transcriptional repressor LexA